MPFKPYPETSTFSQTNIENLYTKKIGSFANDSITMNEKWVMLIPFFERLSSQSCIQILIWNKLINKFIYAVDMRDIAGYSTSNYLTDDGVKFFLSNIHPDFLCVGIKMQQKAEEVFNYERAHITDVIINLDVMYRKHSGDYMHFLLQSVCIEADNYMQPTTILTYVYDITHIKKKFSSNLVITVFDKISWSNFNFENHLFQTVQPLSSQEKKILFLLSHRKTSKEIGEELFISPFTVDTHRKNLLRKTNCIDTTAMITYAKLVGLL